MGPGAEPGPLSPEGRMLRQKEKSVALIERHGPSSVSVEIATLGIREDHYGHAQPPDPPRRLNLSGDEFDALTEAILWFVFKEMIAQDIDFAAIATTEGLAKSLDRYNQRCAMEREAYDRVAETAKLLGTDPPAPPEPREIPPIVGVMKNLSGFHDALLKVATGYAASAEITRILPKESRRKGGTS